MKRSYLIAGILTLVASGWIASGQIDGATGPKVGQKPPAKLTAARDLPTVRVRHQRAQLRTAEIVIRGRTEAERKVDVKAEIHGRIVELLVAKGARIERGGSLARLSDEDRPARLAEAMARLDQRRIEYDAARSLSAKGFRAETQVAAARAALDAADAAVTRAEIAHDNLTIRAPFAGIVGDRMVEIGDYVEIGDPIARVVDLDPILVVARINEKDRDRVVVGGAGQVRLVTGKTLSGRVRYIASEADPVTRTFRVEVEIANPGAAIPDGVTAEVRLPLERVSAHRISPAILTLSESGVIGLMVLGPGNTATFQPVRILGEDAGGLWVAGLAERVTLITVGQEFVSAGQAVRPVDEKTLAPYVAGSAS